MKSFLWKIRILRTLPSLQPKRQKTVIKWKLLKFLISRMMSPSKQSAAAVPLFWNISGGREVANPHGVSTTSQGTLGSTSRSMIWPRNAEIISSFSHSKCRGRKKKKKKKNFPFSSFHRLLHLHGPRVPLEDPGSWLPRCLKRKRLWDAIS